MNDDPVKSPNHYRIKDAYECIDFLEDVLSPEEFIGYLRGNIFKYQVRWRRKKGIEDLRKAEQYNTRLIAFEERKEMSP